MAAQPMDLLQGTLDLIILQSLRWGPRHGYGLVQRIRATTRGVLQVDAGSLYPALHRLERRGWIRAEWGASDNNRRAKYYELTRAGRRQLDTETDQWRKLTTAVSLVLEVVTDDRAAGDCRRHRRVPPPHSPPDRSGA